MKGFKRWVYIQRPVEEVFDFATDLDNISRYMPAITKTELLTEGGVKPGAGFGVRRKPDAPARG